MDGGEILDLVVGNGSPISVAALIIWFVLKRSKVHQEERALDRKERAESYTEHAKERLAVQENFKEYLQSYSDRWAETQAKLAGSLTLLSQEICEMSTRNTAEHGELLEWVRRQKKSGK